VYWFPFSCPKDGEGARVILERFSDARIALIWVALVAGPPVLRARAPDTGGRATSATRNRQARTALAFSLGGGFGDHGSRRIGIDAANPRRPPLESRPGDRCRRRLRVPRDARGDQPRLRDGLRRGLHRPSRKRAGRVVRPTRASARRAHARG